MGAGKTESAIAFMNANPNRRFIFCTPFLDETVRVRDSCPALDFQLPDNYKGRTKSKDFEVLLTARKNIATSHVLFSLMRPETTELIRAGGYTLILDEVMEVISVEKKTGKHDLARLFNDGWFVMGEDYHIKWAGPDDYKGKDDTICRMAQMDCLMYYKETLLFWTLPVRNFYAFDEVYVLTYMFHAQLQRYYYDMHGFEYRYIGTECVDGAYRFCDTPSTPEYARGLIDKVHVFDRLNEIGQSDRYVNELCDPSLSKSWYMNSTERGDTTLDNLRCDAYNVVTNKFSVKYRQYIWTTFEEYEDRIKGKLSQKSYVPCNSRATNKYRDRHYLLYLVNRYHNPLLVNYFKEKGIELDNNAFALSELTQWLWRSAIRCGEDIHVYIPSRRMRALLNDWLERLAAGEPY